MLLIFTVRVGVGRFSFEGTYVDGSFAKLLARWSRAWERVDGIVDLIRS